MANKETLTVTKYKINRCGYYFPYKPDANAHAFGVAAQIFSNLGKWGAGKSLLETQTFAETPDMLATYLLDTSELNGEYLICMWNKSQSTNGQVLTVKATDPVGTHKVSAAKLAKDDIPGYPSYFWIRPKKHDYLTVQLDGGLNGRNSFVKYMESYMERFDPVHVNAKHNSGINAEWHKEISGYQEAIGKKLYPTAEIEPQFRSSMARSAGRVEEIEAQLKDVYKIIKKAELVTAQAAGAGLLRNFLKELGIVDTNVNSDIEYRVRQAFNYNPSAKQFKEIVAQWEADQESYDVGFVIKGNNSPLWLSNSINRTKLEEVPIKRINNFSVDCAALLKELQQRNKHIA